MSKVGTGDQTRLFVAVKNTNADWGLVRSDFELTLLNRDGAVIGVAGRGGVPGALCCTIYQLPPGGTFLVDASVGREAAAVASVEVRALGQWIAWNTIAIDVPSVTVSRAKFRNAPFFGGQRDLRVTGRVTVTSNDQGPFNVAVSALIGGRRGAFVALLTVVNCVRPGRAYAFEASDLVVPPRRPQLRGVTAVTTTVPGVGLSSAPGC